MAFLQCDVKSQILGTACSFNVILNQRALKEGEKNGESPVLYLLHGLSNDHTTWMRKTSIERYAEKYNVSIVMPNAGRSFYTNMYQGYRYMDFLTNELPEIVQSFFRISCKRDQTFIAGTSMGGYGAFKIALNCPERYAAAASLSGPLDLQLLETQKDEFLPDWRLIFGDADAFRNSPSDLNSLIEQRASQLDELPQLYFCCGREDFLIDVNRSFANRMNAFKVDFTYEEDEADHNWDYWDQKIQDVLEWLPLQAVEPPSATTR